MMHPDIAVAIARERMVALRNEADMERLARSVCTSDDRRSVRRYARFGFMRPWPRLGRARVIGPAACPPG
jgi:hypothetical protein